MTYSQMVKQEIYHAKWKCDDCHRKFCDAMLLCFGQSEALYHSDQFETVELLAEMLVAVTGVIATIDHQKQTGKRREQYSLCIEDPQDHQLFLDHFQHLQTDTSWLDQVKKSCCIASVLRGAFLTCGVLVNPEKEYHLEFKLKTRQQADLLYRFLTQIGHPFKQSTRKQYHIVYLKDSEQIEEILTVMGATGTAMEIMQIKLVKDLRNTVNRQTNCETANLDKTVRASMKQVADIEYIVQNKGELYLPDDLRELARVRVEHPEASLSELTELMSFQLSRSGLNHRLKRLSKIAEQLRAIE